MDQYISDKIVLTCLWCVKFNLFLMWWRDRVSVFCGKLLAIHYGITLKYTPLSFDHKRLLIVGWTLATCVSCEIVQRFVIHQNVKVFPGDLLQSEQHDVTVRFSVPVISCQWLHGWRVASKDCCWSRGGFVIDCLSLFKAVLYKMFTLTFAQQSFIYKTI